jgi:glycosyltransferase involved in cell wall biosynthesis
MTASSRPVPPARVLEISAFPPPRAGWSVRVEFLKEQLIADGHECAVLNIGSNRHIPSPEYETVVSGADYVKKLLRYSRRGYRVHAHVNGDSPKGFVLALLGEGINLLHGIRPVLTFHAGLDQTYFPRHKSAAAVPLFKVLFGLARRVVCNTEAVRAKIIEYGVAPGKVVAIPAFSRQYLQFETVPLAPAVEAFYASYRVLFSYIRVRPSFDLTTLIEGFALLAARDPSLGLLLVGLTEDIDQPLWDDLQRRIEARDIRDRICVVAELDHDEFRTALSRSAIYVRTPTSDGASSSVLESLALGVPVVAAENGTRPPGVRTYQAGNPAAMADRLVEVLADRDRIARDMPKPPIADTLAAEVLILTEG